MGIFFLINLFFFLAVMGFHRSWPWEPLVGNQLYCQYPWKTEGKVIKANLALTQQLSVCFWILLWVDADFIFQFSSHHNRSGEVYLIHLIQPVWHIHCLPGAFHTGGRVISPLHGCFGRFITAHSCWVVTVQGGTRRPWATLTVNPVRLSMNETFSSTLSLSTNMSPLTGCLQMIPRLIPPQMKQNNSILKHDFNVKTCFSAHGNRELKNKTKQNHKHDAWR